VLPIFILLRRLSLTVLLLLAATSHAATTKSLSLTSCFIDGLALEVQCGNLSVPENWQQPNAKQLTLNFAVIPAIAAIAEPDPLFILVGGPGQAGVELAPMLSQVFGQVRQKRQLVVIDQRGTGKSSPLSCDDETIDPEISDSETIEPETSDTDVYSQVMSETAVADVLLCASNYDVDLAQYNTNNAVRDFDAVRQALGFQQINLYGISYGSRAALVYMREKPQVLRSVILDAVVPTQAVIGPVGVQATRAFDLLVTQCQALAACNASYPELAATYRQIKQALTAKPLETEILHPMTAQPTVLKVDVVKFISVIHGLLYNSATTEQLPFIISEFAKANYQPFIGAMSQGQNTSASIYSGLNFNILCNEDFVRVTEQQLVLERANKFAGDALFSSVAQVCQGWPKFSAPSNFSTPVLSDIPTLLLSGELDPITPPAWGELAAKGLSNAKHYVAKQASHGLITQTCAATMISQFLKQTSFDDINADCLDQMPQRKFWLNINGNR